MAVLTVSEAIFCVPPFRSALIAPFTGRKPVEFLAFPTHCLLASLWEGFVGGHDCVCVHKIMGTLELQSKC